MLNVGRALHEAQTFTSSNVENEEQLAFMFHVQNSLGAIIRAQTGWTKYGLLHGYYNEVKQYELDLKQRRALHGANKCKEIYIKEKGRIKVLDNLFKIENGENAKSSHSTEIEVLNEKLELLEKFISLGHQIMLLPTGNKQRAELQIKFEEQEKIVRKQVTEYSIFFRQEHIQDTLYPKYVQPAQGELIAEARQTQIQTLAFTWQTLTQLQKEINEEKKKIQKEIDKELDEDKRAVLAQDKKIVLYLQKLDLMNECCSKTLNRLASNIKLTNQGTIDVIKLTEDEEWLFTYPGQFANRIAKLGGRFLPFSQSVDPLYGEGRGHCYGYMQRWIKEIGVKGYSTNLPRLTAVVYKHQAKIIPSSFETMRRFSVQQNSDLRDIVNQLIGHLNTSRVYPLSIRGRDRAHAVALRLIPHTNEVEFFDANFGLVVMDKKNFVLWFANFLCTHYYDILALDGLLLLKVGTEQPKNAKASIPLLKDSYSEEKVNEYSESFSKSQNYPYKLADAKKRFNLKDPEPIQKKVVEPTFFQKYGLRILIGAVVGFGITLLIIASILGAGVPLAAIPVVGAISAATLGSCGTVGSAAIIALAVGGIGAAIGGACGFIHEKCLDLYNKFRAKKSSTVPTAVEKISDTKNMPAATSSIKTAQEKVVPCNDKVILPPSNYSPTLFSKSAPVIPTEAPSSTLSYASACTSR